MSARPLIGVSTSEVRRATDARPAPQSDPRRCELAVGFSYLEAVEQAGGIPVVLPPLAADATDALLDRVDALCLSGGPDITPSSYGADPHEQLGPTEPQLDRFELHLARRARLRGLPLLGICRGLQILNVSRGGTLVQHLPDRDGVRLEHRQGVPGDVPTHRVRIERASRLERVVGGTGLDVNSFHHQAVDRLGAGLRAVAWSADGVVEGVEVPSGEFVVGVQWHAECLVERPEHHALFAALVDAAGARRAAPPPERRAA
ncbi:MAG TPA: gamma-glutamyl-gamma-aminobutyrate hydrolase family protein [Solirubrobacteraceae bacterium]|nr:gamma-glutamyl-gamma-aminobutyrate hydrolase family protein [Solirubrobacteraceae bacterium]